MPASGCVAVKFNGLQLCNGIISEKEKNCWKKKPGKQDTFQGLFAYWEDVSLIGMCGDF